MAKATTKPKRAVKKAAASKKKTLRFSDLNAALAKINPESVILSENTNRVKIDNWIGLGNYMLNAQISGSIFKGIPENRITMIVGESQTGKTFLCLNAARKAQEQGYKVIWADTEQAMDDDSFRRFGVNLDELIYLPINTINDLSHYLSNFADVLLKAKGEKMDVGKYIVIIDSLGNLSTRKEVNDVNSNSEKKDMTRPGEIKRLFRTCTKKLGGLKIPLIVVNHVYANVGSFFGGNIIGGGQGPFLNSSTILYLSKAQLKEDGKNKTGVIVTSKLEKSRFTKGGIPIKFHISFFKGMNPYVGLENYISWENCGIQSGKILPDGSFEPSETARSVAVDHLGMHIPKKDLWTSKVFTKEVLEKLDVLIRSDFELPDIESMDYSSEAILDIDDDDTADNILSDEEEIEVTDD